VAAIEGEADTMLNVGFGENDALSLGSVACLYRVEMASTVAVQRGMAYG
jgi:hypothetical protein